MVERRIKAAKFPTVKSLDSFDFAALPSCPANELVADIHDQMPVIIPPESYDHWLSTLDPDPRGLFVPYPSKQMKIWPISTRVNKPANDDESVLEPVETDDGPSLL